MNKILLVYDDYSELMDVETSLKKFGFDVLGVTSEFTMGEQILFFNPDLVLVSGGAGKVTSLGAGKRLKEMTRWPGKVVLIFGPDNKPAPEELSKIRADLMAESPVPPSRLIQIIAKQLGHNEEQTLGRIHKMSLESLPDIAGVDKDVIYVGGGQKPADTPESLGSSFLSHLKKNEDLYGTARAPVRLQEVDDSSFTSADLKILEAEIFPAFKEDPVAGRGSLEEQEALRPATVYIEQEIENAKKTLSARAARWAQLTADIVLNPVSTVRRKETRRRQLEMSQSWDTDKINDLDGLRREFTRGLFKK